MATTNGNATHTRDDTLVSSPSIGGSPNSSLTMGSPTSSYPPGVTPNVIPPDHPFRTLVLCFDGTGDQFDSDNSNIVEFFSMLKKDDKMKQLVYYQAGIGTYTSPQIATPFFSKISKMMDEAVAWNLNAHVMAGYEFLMQNYTAGDRICIFGFSRGAYTARALAGMIHKVGILPKCNHQQVPFAYKMYTRSDDLGWKQSNAFKKAFSVDADIEFIGVWDTVNSVGLIPKTLPFATSNKIVRTFRHALALDERRAKFKANIWNRPTANEQTLSISDTKIHKNLRDHDPMNGHAHHEHAKKASLSDSIFGTHNKQPSEQRKQKHYEAEYSKDRNVPTDVDEVWFAGCHCDIGGGSVDNAITNNLARIPLRWMIRECFKTKTGIMFHSEDIKNLGIEPDSLWPEVRPRPPPLPVEPTAKIATIAQVEAAVKAAKANADPNPDRNNANAELALVNYSNSDTSQPSSPILKTPKPTEEELELIDALQPIYDQLSLKWFWWILELLPMRQKYQKGDNSWASYLGVNWGKARFIPKQKAHGVRVHRSVKMRMAAQHHDGSKYQPRPEIKWDRVTWVD